ncbi:hypothetical protein Q5752_000307 [Cryptotrichosporon argae]
MATKPKPKPRVSEPAPRRSPASKKKKAAPRRSEPVSKRRRAAEESEDDDDENEGEGEDEIGDEDRDEEGDEANTSQESDLVGDIAAAIEKTMMEKKKKSKKPGPEAKIIKDLRQLCAEARASMTELEGRHGPDARKKKMDEVIRAAERAAPVIDVDRLREDVATHMGGFTKKDAIAMLLDHLITSHQPLMECVDAAIAYYGDRKNAVGIAVAELAEQQSVLYKANEEEIAAAADAEKVIKYMRRMLRATNKTLEAERE